MFTYETIASDITTTSTVTNSEPMSTKVTEISTTTDEIDGTETTENIAEEADLEALRQAALLSIRPKKSAFKVQAHPVRNNLLSIIPVEEDEEKKPEKKVVKSFFNSRQPPAGQHQQIVIYYLRTAGQKI